VQKIYHTSAYYVNEKPREGLSQVWNPSKKTTAKLQRMPGSNGRKCISDTLCYKISCIPKIKAAADEQRRLFVIL
jgi:hypothetical protein